MSTAHQPTRVADQGSVQYGASVEPAIAAGVQRHRSGRKVRSEARDQMLSPEQQIELRAICASPGPQSRVNDFLKKCGLAPLSGSNQHKLWHRYNTAAEDLGLDVAKLRMLQEMATAQGVPLSKMLGDHGLVAVQEIMSAARAGTAEDGAKLIMQGVARFNDAERTDISRDKLAVETAKVRLDRDRFEFDASKAALSCLPELRKIANDSSLDEHGKLLAVRRRLFGVTPD